MPVFFIQTEDIQESTIHIRDPVLFRHLIKSLRFRKGDTISFTDEHRRRYHTRITKIGSGYFEAKILNHQLGPPPSSSTIILAQAIVKNDKMAWIVQKATELGVSHIQPLVTERCLIKLPSSQTQRYRQRLTRIALEAAQQAECWDIPTIREPLSLEQFFLESQVWPRKLLLVERQQGESLTHALAQSPASVVLGIGPEGGWSNRELCLAREAGFRFVTLGERILRAETATLAAICLTQARLGNL